VSTTSLPAERRKSPTFLKLAAEDFDIEPTPVPDGDSKEKKEECYTESWAVVKEVDWRDLCEDSEHLKCGCQSNDKELDESDTPNWQSM
jgi:hypothetical protein